MLENTVLGHVRILSGHPAFYFLISDSTQVTLVGHIVSVQKQATNCVYKLTDGTGALEVRHWSDSISQDDGDDGDEVK